MTHTQHTTQLDTTRHDTPQQTCTQTHTHTHATQHNTQHNAQTQAHTHRHTRTHRATCAHAVTHICMCTCVHTRTSTNTHTHTRAAECEAYACSSSGTVCNDLENCGDDGAGPCRSFQCGKCAQKCYTKESAETCCDADPTCTAVYGASSHWWTFHSTCSEISTLPEWGVYTIYVTCHKVPIDWPHLGARICVFLRMLL